jgi:hypothetical protein
MIEPPNQIGSTTWFGLLLLLWPRIALVHDEFSLASGFF